MRRVVDEVEGLKDAAKLGIAARSQLYLLLSDGFKVPDEELYSDVRSGQFRTWILETIEKLPYQLDAHARVEALTTEVDYDDFNSEFVRLFEVGTPNPPCPLYESSYVGGQIGVFRELVSFYNFFDLSVSKARELPDHLRIELDFIHFLTFRELERVHAGTEAGSYVRAARDFLERHLGVIEFSVWAVPARNGCF
jgi:DMSO reductase family type II enzyme chaperone